MAQFPPNAIISLVGSKPRFDLAESVGPDLQLNELIESPDLGDLALAYGTAAGDPRLRSAIAEAHGVGPDDVVVTIGSMHALFLLAFILCDRGDEAVIAAPCFPPARDVLEAVGAKVQVVTLSFDRGYRLDPLELRSKLRPDTRLVSLASPQNPSGVAIPTATLREILALIDDICPDAYLLIDETYREAAYGDDPISDTAVALSPRVISVASLSKCHGAPGLRLGWAITRNPELREQLVVAKFNTVISCSVTDEAFALRLLGQRLPIIAARRQRLLEGLQRTADWVRCNNDSIDWVRPSAGAMCCIRLKSAVFDDAAVGRFYDLIAQKGARVANGDWFGDEARVFRVGFGILAMADFDEGLAVLATALRQASEPVRSS
jgi:hypothetical protein